MDKLNGFQTEFMETLSALQEQCVHMALSQNDARSLEDRYYDLTSETIIRIMELMDGYYNRTIGNLNVTCEKTGEGLKTDPYIELHDVVCHYLKGAD